MPRRTPRRSPPRLQTPRARPRSTSGAVSSKQIAPDGNDGSRHACEHAEDGEQALARQEIQRAEDQAELQQSLADVIAQCAVFLDRGLLLLGASVFLDFLGVRRVLGSSSLQ